MIDPNDDPYAALVPRRRASDQDDDPYAALAPRRRATDQPYRYAGGAEGLKALPGAIGATVRAGLQGATLGFSDELAGGIAGLGALLPGGRSPREAYTEERDRIRSGLKEFRGEHPIASTALELAGGIVPAIATGGGSLPATLGTGAKVLQAAKAGAKFGGLYGAGKAEGDLLTQALATTGGAAFGGAGGALLGAAVPAAKAIGGAITRKVASGSSPLAPAAAQAAEQQAQERGASLVLQSMQREGLSPLDAQMRIQAARASGVPDVALADVATGGNVKGLMDLAATRPGPAKTAITGFTEKRAGSMRQTMASALDQHTGLPARNLFELKRELVLARDKAAGDLFEPMFRAVPFVDDPAVAEAVATVEKASPAFAKYARQLARLHKVPTEELVTTAADPRVAALIQQGASPAALAAQGLQVTQRAIPSLRYVHYLKEAVDSHIGREMAMVNKGGSKAMLSGLEKLKVQLRDATVAAVPDYGKALGQYAGDSEIIRAMELGKRLLHSNSDPVDFATQFAAMSPSEQDVFRLAGSAAARQFLQGKAALAPTPTNAWWNNPAMQQKLRLLFPDDGAFEQFMAAVATTRQKALTGQAGGNSATAGRLMADEDLGEGLASGIGRAAVTGDARGGLRTLLRSAEAATKSRALGDAAPYLTATGGDLDAMIRRLALEQALMAVPRAAQRGQAQILGGYTGRSIGSLTETPPPRRLR